MSHYKDEPLDDEALKELDLAWTAETHGRYPNDFYGLARRKVSLLIREVRLLRKELAVLRGVSRITYSCPKCDAMVEFMISDKEATSIKGCPACGTMTWQE